MNLRTMHEMERHYPWWPEAVKRPRHIAGVPIIKECENEPTNPVSG